MIDNSQHKESSFIYNYICKKNIECHKSIIEIGACDGVHLSNAKYFIDKNWEAYLVEPSNFYWNDLVENYKENFKVTSFKNAIFHNNQNVRFFENKKSIDHSKISDKGYIVEGITYYELIKRTKLKDIGIVSIDTEGMDTPILSQLLQHHIKPKFVIIESNVMSERRKQINLINNHYDLINVLNVNMIWVRKGLIRETQI